MKNEEQVATFTTPDPDSGLPLAVPVRPTEVTHLVRSGTGCNIKLRNGDILWVSQSRPEVYDTLGEVARANVLNREADGHNPDGLTNAQVETDNGWRLLTPTEIRKRCADPKRGPSPHIQVRLGENALQPWSPAGIYSGTSTANTYRTKKPAGYFLTQPAEPTEPVPPRPAVTVNQQFLIRLLASQLERLHALEASNRRARFTSAADYFAQEAESARTLLDAISDPTYKGGINLTN